MLRLRLSFLVLAVSLTIVVPAGAQTRDEITVSAVDVPVYVTRNGLPVHGLKRDDFELYVNGKLHPIDYFDVITESAPTTLPAQVTPAPATAERPELQRRRLFLLLFDVMNSSTIKVHRAKLAAQNFVAAAPPGDTFAVATIGSEGVNFSVAFTNDRVAVQRAIGTLRPSTAGDVFSLATLKTERARWAPVPQMGIESSRTPDQWLAAGVQPTISFEQSISAVRQMEFRKQYAEMEAIGHTALEDHYFDALGALAARLAPLSGVKHVILLREGSSLSGVRNPLSVIVPMQKRFRAAGVVLDAVDLGGLRAPFEPPGHKESRFDFKPLLNDPTNILFDMALDTGGTVIKDRTDLDVALKALRDMRSVTYVLGFKPPADQNATNEIRVKVRNLPFLGTNVQFRRSYAASVPRKTSDGIFLADVMLNDIPQGGINVNVAVQPAGEEATVVTSVPGVEVMAHATDRKTLLDVFIYVFDAQNVVAGWSHSRLLVDTEAGEEFLSANPYSVRLPFALAPGRYVAKALVRVVGKEDVTGFQRSEFRIGG